MKIGIISNHFSFPAINYLIMNNLVAGFAVPEVQSPVFRILNCYPKLFISILTLYIRMLYPGKL